MNTSLAFVAQFAQATPTARMSARAAWAPFWIALVEVAPLPCRVAERATAYDGGAGAGTQ
ncbi:hypothetical protein ACFHWS_21350 [Micromonospora sp. LOL_013]|uniref:hypothetical protein n=1 Tax=unclassified Micromonospora TaxID=2617518 RepID=UPI003A86100B